MNNFEIIVITGLAGSALGALGQRTSNKNQMDQAFRSEKYSAYLDFASSVNRLLRSLESFIKTEQEVDVVGLRVDERGKEVSIISGQVIDSLVKRESLKLEEPSGILDLDDAEVQDLKTKLDRIGKEGDHDLELMKNLRTDLNSKRIVYFQILDEMNRALSKLQLSASPLVLNLGQDLYFGSPQRLEKGASKNINHTAFHKFVIAARWDLDHPRHSRLVKWFWWINGKPHQDLIIHPNTSSF